MPKLIWKSKLQEAVKLQQRFGWYVSNLREKSFCAEIFPVINKKFTATHPNFQ